MLRFALLLLSIPLLAHGGEALYYAARSRHVTTVSCDQVTRVPPRVRWLRVTGCDIDYMHPGFRTSGTQVNELFFAMRKRNEGQDASASLLVATRDRQALTAAQDALAGGSEVDDETFTVAMLRVVDILRAAREVDGYARAGLLDRLLARRALAGFGPPLTPDAIVLDLHARPPLLAAAMETGAGLFLLSGAALWRRRAPAAGAPIGSTGSPADAASSVPPSAARPLPPAMLLNLEPSAPRTDIEYAPPLGSRQEVAAQITRVLGTLVEEGDGRYGVAGADWRLGFDVGREDPVWTVAVEVRGNEAAVEALDTLARETSWRVYVPRLGVFR